MITLLKNAQVVNVFTDEIQAACILIEDERIVGVGDYAHAEADVVYDLQGAYVCPGFMDSHIHIESTMLSPLELAKVCVPHGTTAIVADPHEIANVCGTDGIQYMLEASEGLPMTCYMMMPSCVPATPFCESGATLSAADLRPFYDHPRVLGLGEVMNAYGIIHGDSDLLEKIQDAHERGLVVNGHGPLLTGSDLDRYVAQGIQDDHECTSVEEAREKIHKGQWVMIRQGTAARNLAALMPLFDAPWNRRCTLASDDKHPADLLESGHMDGIMRMAVAQGADPVVAIRMATIQTAQCMGLSGVGAVAPGYLANLAILSDLGKMSVTHVFYRGVPVAQNGALLADLPKPAIAASLQEKVLHSFHLDALKADDFILPYAGTKMTRVIQLVPGELLTHEWITFIDYDRDCGIDTDRDIVQLAVLERHRHTGNRGIGFVTGSGLKRGAIAASVSHDSHNLIVMGVNHGDMAFAANRIRQIGGGCVVVCDGQILSEMPLPIAGLMADQAAETVAVANRILRENVYRLGVPEGNEPFMAMAFVSLPVIPHLKMTTKGLVDVNRQQLLPLCLSE